LLVAILAAITMTIGNLAAIPQRNLKRLMAYSSIAHAGYLLMGFATLSPEGIQAILFYLITYLLMNFGAFLVILAIADRKGTEEIDGYRGLGWTSPIMAGALTVFLFSLTGLPPFAGFIGKFFLFAAVIKHGLYWLAVVAVINSVISLFYYARIIKAMYLTMPLSPAPIAVAGAYRTLAWILAIPTLILGIYWEPLATFAARSAASFF
jgi:NADH-quinone oxidoreductase subunit N